ncbi:RDD family protein [Salinimicrobium gaetbulicola]|uniref:RDD family protein n=1 Tax=Salinimicrobium gaetbulicola TaxID=999702 RepID=A0ABW3IAN3_9FLAO
MDNFQIETAQNISISQNVAGIGERILAYLIDLLIMFAYVITVILILGSLNLKGPDEWVFMVIIGLPLFLYFLLWEAGWNGRSPGKAALHLRVVMLDGSKPHLSNYLVRWLLRMVDITFTSGSVAVISILITGKGQRLGDLAAGTTVISEKERFGLQHTLLYDLPDNYTPVYPQVTILSDKDVQEIKNLYKEALQNSNFRLIRSLSQKVSDLLGVTPKENASDFVKTVIMDYNYYTQQL